MPKLREREYRNLAMPLATAPDNKRMLSDYYVEGYATTFEPYVLFEMGGNKYYEKIAPGAFEDADMSDVIFQYDHNGKVLARRSNETLGLEIDSKGLFIDADLSKSAAAKEMYEEIKAGLVTKMSWAFTIAEESYNSETRTWTILKVKKVYDVSAASIPANDDTEISARNLERRSYVTNQQERLGLERQKLKLKIKLEVQV